MPEADGDEVASAATEHTNGVGMTGRYAHFAIACRARGLTRGLTVSRSTNFQMLRAASIDMIKVRQREHARYEAMSRQTEEEISQVTVVIVESYPSCVSIVRLRLASLRPCTGGIQLRVLTARSCCYRTPRRFECCCQNLNRTRRRYS